MTVLLVSGLANLVRKYIDKRQVYNWMNKESSGQSSHEFRSTRAIASWNNLTEDRVRYICSIHKKIYLSTGEKEDMWSLTEASARDKTH